MCAAGGVTRVAVLYALLGALCPPNAPDAPDVEAPAYIKAAIMQAMRSNHRVTLHQLRRLRTARLYLQSAECLTKIVMIGAFMSSPNRERIFSTIR